MTKAELIDRIARSRDLPPDVTKKVIAKILDLGFAELTGYFVRSRLTRASTPRFSYPKFGTFIKKKRSGRRGINPRTLEPMEIEACETLDFKPSTELKRLLNEASAPTKSAKAKSAKAKSAKAKSAKAKSAKAKSAKPARKKKAARSSSKATKAKPAGPGGRKLLARDELELPSAPLQKVELEGATRARRPKQKLDAAGS